MIKQVTRKNLNVTESGRSSDYITPSFIFNCGFECSYCYCKRHINEDVTVAKNASQLLDVINSHAFFTVTSKPNQTHDTYTTYDVGCNSDMALHLKHWDWKMVFDFFKQHPIAMGTFATKYVNKELLSYNPEGKMRIRFSLMPQVYSDLLEPKTSSIVDRINAINIFIEAGYDVHVNFSPVIVTEGWLKEYKLLFELLDASVKEEYKHQVKAEVIFLTHNEKKHTYNIEHKLNGEDLLWKPSIQEPKTSQYGGKNIRYSLNFKSKFIQQFKTLHSQTIPWNTIRYIF